MSEHFPETPNEVLALLPESKVQISIFADRLIESVKNGQESALKIKSFLKKMEEVLKRFDSETKDEQLNEANGYPEKKFNLHGYDIEKSEVGVKYDYSKCDDPVWSELSVRFKNLQGELKERETFLKTITKPTTIVIDESGEVVTINPAARSASDGLKFSMK